MFLNKYYPCKFWKVNFVVGKDSVITMALKTIKDFTDNF